MYQWKVGDKFKYTNPFPGILPEYTISRIEEITDTDRTKLWVSRNGVEVFFYLDKYIQPVINYTKEELICMKIKQMTERHQTFLQKRAAC